jgi:hypothetical protein
MAPTCAKSPLAALVGRAGGLESLEAPTDTNTRGATEIAEELSSK